jgi:DNA-binding response OmpR family regulator
MMKKILLADDSITIQKVVGIIFSTEEYQLEMTDDGDSAFRKALEDIPDLVIADISMPGKDGFELCRAIKSEPSLAKTSVLLLPGAFDHFDEIKAGEVCADGWLTKPFESQALLDKVSQLLEAEPVRMAGVEAPVAEDMSAQIDTGITGLDDNLSVTESGLGLDDVEEFSTPTDERDEESPDDIWDAVSFAEEDLQEQSEISRVDSGDEVSFAADVIDPSVIDDVAIEPATDEEVLSAFVPEAEEELESPPIEGESESSYVEEFQPETFVSVDTAEEDTDTGLSDQPELVSEVVSQAPLAEAVDFSVFSEDESEIQQTVEEEPVPFVAEPNIEEDVLDLRAEIEPFELIDDSLDQDAEVAVVETEPAPFAIDSDDEEAVMELREEDEFEFESVILDDSDASFVAEVGDETSEEGEILDLLDDEIVADEVEPLVAEAPEPEPEDEVFVLSEVEDEFTDEIEKVADVAEDETFYFDANAAGDESDAAVTAGVVDIATGAAAIHFDADVETSVTEQVEQQLRELSADE